MRKFIAVLTTFLTLTVTTSAMSYTTARELALFLTDKMAYELNLTEEQYDAAYEINLDYLMSINTHADLYGDCWTNRNLDFSYILLDWQYSAFCAASYFYRPLYWDSGVWHFTIYTRYPIRDYFYFGRPNIYISYHGGHSWRQNGGHSWYKGRTFNHGSVSNGNGMKDRLDRGEFNGSKKESQTSKNTSESGNRYQGTSRNKTNNNDRTTTSNKPATGIGNNRKGQPDRNANGQGNRYQGTTGNKTSAGNRTATGAGNNKGRQPGRNNRESSTRTTVRTGSTGGTQASDNTRSTGSTARKPSGTFIPNNRSSGIFNRGSQSTTSGKTRSTVSGSISRSSSSGNKNTSGNATGKSSSKGGRK